MKKLILQCGVLRSICAVGMMAFAVTAEAEIVKEYTLNDSLTATLDDQGVLKIIGSGDMPQWSNLAEQAWIGESSRIRSVVAEGEITVGQCAFFCCNSLTSVSLPKATAIGLSAFDSCSSLTSVSLPNAMTIETWVFNSCKSLESVSLPSATTIGSGAFEGCSKLNSVSLPNASTINGGVFRDCSSLTSVSLPNATTIGASVFDECENLALVSLPAATRIGLSAFKSCSALSSLLVNCNMKSTIDEQGRNYYRIPESTTIITELLPEEVVKNAGYVVQEAVVDTNVQLAVSSEVKVQPSVTLKSGDTALDKTTYEGSCAFYGVTPQTQPETPKIPAEPTSEDFRVVPRDAQVIGSDEIAVKKESIQAAKAETISIANNEVRLGVSVMSNANITAEIAEWGKVNLSSENVKVENGNVVITIPVSSASGFMILQSGDAKVQSNELKLSGGKVFTGDY